VIKEVGSYVVGGRTVRVAGAEPRMLQITSSASYTFDPNGTCAVEHAWVQFYVPTRRNARPPVVLLHGGGLHGGMWDTTPDGRPGWLQNLLALGFEVHVVDNVERGRAGWMPGLWPGEPSLRTLEDAWTLFRFGTAEGFDARVPFDGCRFPVQHLENLGRLACPRWTSTTAAQTTALGALLGRLQRSIVVCHSQGAEIAFAAAVEDPDRVEALVAVEPSGSPDAIERLVDIPVVVVEGDFLQVSPLWQALSARWRGLVTDLQRAGGRAQLLSLAARWPGTTHMPMMDRDSDQLLAHVVSAT
jgi:pimeloyl-ACP methyl ester carboxylesterase